MVALLILMLVLLVFASWFLVFMCKKHQLLTKQQREWRHQANTSNRVPILGRRGYQEIGGEGGSQTPQCDSYVPKEVEDSLLDNGYEVMLDYNWRGHHHYLIREKNLQVENKGGVANEMQGQYEQNLSVAGLPNQIPPAQYTTNGLPNGDGVFEAAYQSNCGSYQATSHNEPSTDASDYFSSGDESRPPMQYYQQQPIETSLQSFPNADQSVGNTIQSTQPQLEENLYLEASPNLARRISSIPAQPCSNRNSITAPRKSSLKGEVTEYSDEMTTCTSNYQNIPDCSQPHKQSVMFGDISTYEEPIYDNLAFIRKETEESMSLPPPPPPPPPPPNRPRSEALRQSSSGLNVNSNCNNTQRKSTQRTVRPQRQWSVTSFGSIDQIVEDNLHYINAKKNEIRRKKMSSSCCS
ncbi:hypothetical protein CAPTEDRAFT_194114 [Capitella teleta]|uniref:WH2 domain-containing protein n=1 Tax=Capitella teleta TaxID=283909 RepID=R7U4R4_CAPTE|nr:hypothetical protein CAPTEDRAFT_194114 [Capitella teleta]|eukprot:ELU00919.1 hypothetical protein CAPTEDRAFT_194114 [Capitella teleta]